MAIDIEEEHGLAESCQLRTELGEVKYPGAAPEGAET